MVHPRRRPRVARIDATGAVRGYVDALALAPNAGFAATGERGGQILVRSTTPGDGTPATLGDYREEIVDLAFAPDGRLLASLGRGRENALRSWRLPRLR